MQTAIGVDLGGSHVTAAVVTEDGAIHRQHEEDLEDLRLRGRDRRARRDDRYGAARTPETSPESASARPATSTPRSGAVLYSPNFGWQDAPLGESLRKKFRTAGLRRQRRALRDARRVYVRNRQGDQGFRSPDARHGNRRRNRRREASCCSGNRWGAGEIGHHQIRPSDGFVCGCGKIGCFEAQASGTGLIRHAFAVAPSFPRSAAARRSARQAQLQEDSPSGAGRRRSRACSLEELHRRSRDRAGKRHRVRQSREDRVGRRRFDGRRLHARRGAPAGRRADDDGAEGNDANRRRVARQRRRPSRRRHDGVARRFDYRSAPLRYKRC